jgi:hypothetical protein
VKAGWIVASAVDGAAVVIGHLPAGLEPGRLGQFRPEQLKRRPTVSRPARSRYATSGRVSGVGIPPEKWLQTADYALVMQRCTDHRYAPRSICYGRPRTLVMG